MSHKDEAVAGAARIQAMDVSDNFHALTADIIAYYQLKATLALVEAQEAANEQDEIARAEALYSLIHSVPHGMDDEYSEIRPDVARALGIGGAE